MTGHPGSLQTVHGSSFESRRDGGGVYVVNALGGGLRRVAERGIFPRFTPDGSSIVYAVDPDWASGRLRPMFRVPANGGAAEPFLPGWGVQRPPGSSGPIFSPDGKLVIFSGAPLDDPRRQDWWVAPVDGGEPWSSGRTDAMAEDRHRRVPIELAPGQIDPARRRHHRGHQHLHCEHLGSGATERPGDAPHRRSRDELVTDKHRRRPYRLLTLFVGDSPLGGRARPGNRTKRWVRSNARRTTPLPRSHFSLTEDGNRLAYSTYCRSPRCAPRRAGHPGPPDRGKFHTRDAVGCGHTVALPEAQRRRLHGELVQPDRR